MCELPKLNDFLLLEHCGFPIGSSVFIRPNSSDWCYDWCNVELIVVGVGWNVGLKKWEFTCISNDESDILYELDIDDLTRFNCWR